MGSLSDYSEDIAMNLVFNATAYSPVATVYLAVSTADPLDTGAGIAEPVAMGYIRKAIAFSTAAARASVQNGAVVYNQATGTWGDLTHYAVFDAETAGNMLCHGAFSATKTIVSGKTLTVPTTQVVVSIDAGDMSTYLAHKLLNMFFFNTAYTAPAVYCGLAETTELTDDTTGTTVDDLDMTGYARQLVAAADWGPSTAGVVTNTAAIDFGTLTGTGETITAAFLADAITAGNILIYDNSQNIAVVTGESVSYAIGAFTATLT